MFKVSDPGRVAAVSNDLITELAARRVQSADIADSSLSKTLALFLWLAETLENQDMQLLSAQVEGTNILFTINKNFFCDKPMKLFGFIFVRTPLSERNK